MSRFLSAQSMFSPRIDMNVGIALLELQDQVGALFSVEKKRKRLRKFGRTNNADDGVSTTVGAFQGAVVNETFATANTIDFIVSDDAADTGAVTVEGHYEDASGRLVFSVQNAVLAGLTPVALNPALIRCTRIKRTDGTVASPSTPLVGNVYAYDATLAGGVAAGVPIDATATKCMITAGKQQSEKLSSTLSYSDAYLIDGVSLTASRQTGSGVTVEADVEYRKRGGVWLPLGLELVLRTADRSSVYIPLPQPALIFPDTDFRMSCIASANDTFISGFTTGTLATRVSI